MHPNNCNIHHLQWSCNNLYPKNHCYIHS
uniref:Uncharacterized protein n=1 Tax=Arundo donax TaxID=35708 RepID=A0A0A9H550_ARUDO